MASYVKHCLSYHGSSSSSVCHT